MFNRSSWVGDEKLMAEYVNRGTDARVGGVAGQIAATVQRKLSYQTPEPPKVARVAIGLGHIAVAWPPFVSIFIPRGDDKYFSFRAGWRFDQNWGDGNNPNEPKIEKPGGYIADVIIKTSIDHVVEP